MAKKKKVGRPKESDKVKTEYVYIRGSDKKKILTKYPDLTKALTEGVLPEC
jgi:hypothetical protein